MAQTQQPTPLLIDTDTASDDAVALILAAASGLGRIVAVTTVAGNVPVEQATRNALVTLELAGAGDVPVFRGCERPLVRPATTAQHVHGDDGMSGAPLPAPTARAQPEHAVDAILRLARTDRQPPLTLVTLGPLTNLAAALVRDRGLLSRFAHVYCMAGTANCVGNISATAEYNVWADPEAATIVLDAAEPDLVTLVGWDVSARDAVMTPADQAELRGIGTPLALLVDRINQAVNDWATKVTGLAGYDLPDPITMAIALRPTLATEHERLSVGVGRGDEARGQLLIDRRRTAAPPNVTVVRRADGAAFRAMLSRTCTAASPHPVALNGAATFGAATEVIA